MKTELFRKVKKLKYSTLTDSRSKYPYGLKERQEFTKNLKLLFKYDCNLPQKANYERAKIAFGIKEHYENLKK